MAINLDRILHGKSKGTQPITTSVQTHEPLLHADQLDDILLEWSYRLPNGYPTIKNGRFSNDKELAILREILQESGINEMPDFTNIAPIKMQSPTPIREEEDVQITASDLVKLLGNPDSNFSQKTLDRVASLLKRQGNYEKVIEEKITEFLGPDAKHVDAVVDKMYAGNTDQMKLAAYLSDRSISYTSFLNKVASIKGTFQGPTGLSDKAFEELVVYKWQDTPALGIVEVMLAMLFKGGARPTGMGDLVVGGKPFEVGGVNKRLRGQKGFGTAKGFLDLSGSKLRKYIRQFSMPSEIISSRKEYDIKLGLRDRWSAIFKKHSPI